LRGLSHGWERADRFEEDFKNLNLTRSRNMVVHESPGLVGINLYAPVWRIQVCEDHK
jgi:hypothetical protein